MASKSKLNVLTPAKLELYWPSEESFAELAESTKSDAESPARVSFPESDPPAPAESPERDESEGPE